MCVCVCVCVCAYTSHVTISGRGWWRGKVLEGSHLLKKKKKKKGRVNAESQVGSGGGWGMTGVVVHSEGYSETSPRKKKKKKEAYPNLATRSCLFFLSLSWPSPLCVGPDGLLCVEMSPPPLPTRTPNPPTHPGLRPSLSWEHMTAEHQQLAFLTEPNSPAFPCLPEPAKTAPFYPFHCLLQTNYNKQRGRQNIY